MIMRDNFAKHFLPKISGVLFITSLFILACQPSLKKTQPVTSPYRLDTILVMPFTDMSSIYGEHMSVRCPICAKVFVTGKVKKSADSFLTDRLLALLKQRERIHLIPPGQAQGVLSRILLESERELKDFELIIEIGRALGADAILTGHIYRFRERTGTKYAIETPAAVTFDLDLVRVNDGRVLWESHFKETQQTLTSNLFDFGKFLKRKGRWITAEEMAASGLEEILKTFPVL
jgi:hypothetical protein